MLQTCCLSTGNVPLNTDLKTVTERKVLIGRSTEMMKKKDITIIWGISFILACEAWWFVFHHCKTGAANIMSVDHMQVCAVLWGMNTGKIKSKITEHTVETHHWFLILSILHQIPLEGRQHSETRLTTTPSASLSQVSRLQQGQRNRKMSVSRWIDLFWLCIPGHWTGNEIMLTEL